MRIVFVLFFLVIFTACSESSSKIDNNNLDSDNSTTDEQVSNDDVQFDETVDNEKDDNETEDKAVNDKEVTDEINDETEDETGEISADEADDETVDESSDEIADETVDETPDEDTSSSDHVEVINNANGSVTVNVTLNAEKDAVTSYLMDAPTSSWNYFYGSSVNIGFRVYSALDDQYVAYHSAFRFTDVDVPAGSTIESASFSFHPTNEVDSSKKIYLRAAMEKAINSEAFDTSNYTTNRPDQRSETDATVEETLLKCIELDDCYDPESSYCKDRALDCWDREVRFTFRGELSDIVQEIIDTTGWARKNAMTVFITGTYPSAMSSGEKPDYSNDRSVTGYDTDKAASHYPVLSITFTVK